MILSQILVIKCDECPEIVVVQSDEKHTEFEEKWFDGCFSQFCPTCRIKPELRTKIQADQMVFESSKTLIFEKIAQVEITKI